MWGLNSMFYVSNAHWIHTIDFTYILNDWFTGTDCHIASKISPVDMGKFDQYLNTKKHNKMRAKYILSFHDDVIKWKHFPRYWTFVRGIHRSPVNSPHKRQWRETLMFSMICACINDQVNNREAGDLRRYCAHYDVTVMQFTYNHKGCRRFSRYPGQSREGAFNGLRYALPLLGNYPNEFLRSCKQCTMWRIKKPAITIQIW